MKRRGCIDCHLIEPTPGLWIAGRCPNCAELHRLRQERQPDAPAAKAVKDEALAATAIRLQGYLARIAEQYPSIWRQIDRMRAERGRTIPQWPSWCFMPMAGAFVIASGGRTDAPPEQLAGLGAISALAAWRPTQGIYRFDPSVAAAVQDTPLTGDIPTEVLYRLPEWCVYIETPGMMDLDLPSLGFFAWLEHDANDQREELRFAIDVDGKISIPLPVHLGGGLLAGIEKAKEEAARQSARHAIGPSQIEIMSVSSEMMAANLAPRINLLLYLCSTNAELRERVTGRLRPQKPTLTKTKDGMRMFPAEKPMAWEVGYRLGAAIRRAQDTPRPKPGGGSHASPRAHVRRAHWHAFWSGTKATVTTRGDRKLIVHWMPPIPVNVDEGAPVVPALHKIGN